MESTLLAAGDPASTDIWAVANMPVLWIFAVSVFVVIFLQTVLYFRAARASADGIQMPQSEIKEAFRAGAIASIGPSLAVVLVAIALLALFGTPAVLVRVGLIGSAATETASASIAAVSMGSELGDASYTQQVFGVAFIAMSLSGAMWMLCTLLLTPMLKRGSSVLQKKNPAIMALIPSAALLGAFSMISVSESAKSSVHLILVGVSGAVMALCLYLASVLNAKWLKEWGLGFAILISLFVGYLLHAAA